MRRFSFWHCVSLVASLVAFSACSSTPPVAAMASSGSSNEGGPTVSNDASSASSGGGDASSGDASSADAATGDASSGDGAAAFAHDVVLTMNLTVPAMTELHQCQFVQVPAGADINVVGFAHRYTLGSHHFLLYQTDLTAIPPDMTGQYDCTWGNEPIMQHSKNIIYGAQKPSGAFPFPAGVAVTIPAGSVLIMNTHYLNQNPAPIATTVQAGLDTTTPDKVTTQAGAFLFYDPFIDVPANSQASSGGRCPVPADVTIINAFTHYHYRGSKMQVWVDPVPAAPVATPFYVTTDWEHPQDFQGPATWAKGSVVRFQCDYNNTESTEIFQGPNAKTSEMCVFAGLYYPKQAHSFESCSQYSTMGFGTKTCSATASCLQACPPGDAPMGVAIGPCWEHCVAAGCNGAVDRALLLFGCVSNQCSAECAPVDGGAPGAACATCQSTKCVNEQTACGTHVCQ